MKSMKPRYLWNHDTLETMKPLEAYQLAYGHDPYTAETMKPMAYEYVTWQIY